MTAAPPARHAWAAMLVVLLLSVLVVFLGFRQTARFNATLPGAISSNENIPPERWSAAFNQNFRSSAAADARNSLAVCATINGVYIGRNPPGTLQNMTRPLQAIRNGQCARLWLLAAKLTQLHRADTPPAEWWASIEAEVSPLAKRPPAHGLGALVTDVTANYASGVGLDPMSARQLATDQLSYTHGTTLQILCDLLPRVETSPENTAVLQRLLHDLLAAWVAEDGPIALRLLAAQKLAECLEAHDAGHADAAALRAWRTAVRGELSARPPTLLGLMARQPTPAGSLQTAWVQHYLQLHWFRWTLYGAAPLALLGLIALFREGVSRAHAAAAVLASAAIFVLALLLPEEWMLHSFRLGYPFIDDWPTFGWLAIAVGAVVPFASGWLASPRGRVRGGLIASACVVPLLALLLWIETAQAAQARASFVAAATAPETDLAVICPPPVVKSAAPSG